MHTKSAVCVVVILHSYVGTDMQTIGHFLIMYRQIQHMGTRGTFPPPCDEPHVQAI